MKRNNNSFLNRLSTTTLEKLTLEVKETLAIGLQPANQPVFTAAQLWNIQRQYKTRTSRRFL